MSPRAIPGAPITASCLGWSTPGSASIDVSSRLEHSGKWPNEIAGRDRPSREGLEARRASPLEEVLPRAGRQRGEYEPWRRVVPRGAERVRRALPAGGDERRAAAGRTRRDRGRRTLVRVYRRRTHRRRGHARPADSGSHAPSRVVFQPLSWCLASSMPAAWATTEARRGRARPCRRWRPPRPACFSARRRVIVVSGGR